MTLIRKKMLLLEALMLLCCLPALASGEGGNRLYPAADIPAELRKGADAVVRNETTTFRVISPGKAIETLELAVTILNGRGDAHAQMTVHYDKLRKVKTFEGALYAADGKLVKRLKKADIIDGSAFSGSFMEDNRFKTASLEHKEYPFTVVWTTETETSNTMFYPSWVPPVSKKVSVEYAALLMVCPQGLSFEHRAFGLPEPVAATDQKGNNTWQWAVSGLQAKEGEPLAPYWQGSQVVLTRPLIFEIDGQKGSMQSWQQYGAFIQQLNQGRDILPQEVVDKVNALTSGLTTAEDKVKAVYEYMQQNTRYVSIQLGIGGWQPFEAAFVAQKGYGDCKALSNYTLALLKAAGIRSHYAIISAGAEKKEVVLEDFPQSYFNHAILCVPLQKDTLWLECTSQINPFGHLGSFTGNRKALLITESGGKLVNTRTYTHKDNVRNTHTFIDLHQEQPGFKISRTYSGILFDGVHTVMRSHEQQQKDWLYQQAGLPEVSIKQYALENRKTKAPAMLLQAEGVLQEKLQRSGSRLFVPLALGEFPLELPRPVADRKTDFVQAWGYTYSDTLMYQVPAAFKAEHLPAPVRLHSDFGTYELEAVYERGQIRSVERLCLYEGKHPASRYAEWVAFVQKLRSAHASKAVLVEQD